MKSNFYKLFAGFLFAAGVLLVSVNQLRAQIITTIAGTGYGQGNPQNGMYTGDGGPATLATMKGPFGVAVDDSGNIYIAEHYNHIVRKIDNATGIINTIGCNGTPGFSGDGGPATAAQCVFATGLALDDSGNVYFCDLYNNRIRKITKATGIISTVAGIGPNGSPAGTYAGNGSAATSASLKTPYGVAVDHAFNIYIADTYNNVIRKIDKVTGIISTVVGDGYQAGVQFGGRYTGDGGPALLASLTNPYGIAFDDSDNMFIADSYANAIRRVDRKTDTITTVAGTGYGASGGTGGSGTGDSTGDGGPATSARLYHPLAVTVDHLGNIYISDQLNNLVRRVDHLTGIITVVAGDGYGAFSNGNAGDSTGDGGPATSARLWCMQGLAVDKCNNLYICDFNNNKVRKVTFNSSVSLAVTPASATICSGGNTTLKASGAQNYTWSPAGGLSSTNDSVVVANPTASVTYSVTGTSGCSSAMTTVAVTVNSASAPLTVAPATAAICSGSTVTFTVSGGANGTTYHWSPSASLDNSTGDTVIATAPSKVDSIVFTVTDTSSLSCPAVGYATLYITANDTPGTITAQRDTICQGTTGLLALSGNSSDSIRWQFSSDSINYTDIGGHLAVDTNRYRTVPLLESAWYQVIVGKGSCSAVSFPHKLVVPPSLTASFKFSLSGKTVTFNSDSSKGQINSYFWDFGDGATSTEQNPTHTYTGDSTYSPCLTIYDGSNCSYTYCRPIFTAIGQINAAGSWNIYPNPFGNKLNIDTKTFNSRVQSIEMIDVLGRVMISGVTGNANSTAFELNTSALAKGMYFLTIKTVEANYVQKIVKQ